MEDVNAEESEVEEDDNGDGDGDGDAGQEIGVDHGPSAADWRFAEMKRQLNRGKGREIQGKCARFDAPFGLKRRAVKLFKAGQPFGVIQRQV